MVKYVNDIFLYGHISWRFLLLLLFPAAFAYYKWAEYCFWTVEQGHRKKNLPEYEAYFASLKEQAEAEAKK